MKEEQTWDCPFCGSNTIRIVFFPRTAIAKKGNWGGSRAWMQVSKERYQVLSGCSNCGKTKEEVEKALNEKKEPSREDILKRLREAGLDPSKLK